MRILTSFILFFLAAGFNQAVIFAAPFSGDYPRAPRATPAEARQKVIEAAKKYIGTPYLYAGITVNGLDCSGFIYVSYYDALGVSTPRSAAGIHSWAEAIPLANAQPGDLLFFRTGNTNAITHVGLYIGDRQFLHAASAGSKTGVIYSNLDEQYYVNTYASAGRALPASSSNSSTGSGKQKKPAGTSNDGSRGTNKLTGDSRYLVGAALALNWDFYQLSGNVLRGFTSQICFGLDFGPMLSFGIELRSEFDDALGVFRLPLTLSWAPNEMFRIFVGPALSFGDASFVAGKKHLFYYGGTNWLGSAGVTFTPFPIKISNSEFCPYLEAVWQTYFNKDPNNNLLADFLACTRFSTGVRWRMRL